MKQKKSPVQYYKRLTHENMIRSLTYLYNKKRKVLESEYITYIQTRYQVRESRIRKTITSLTKTNYIGVVHKKYILITQKGRLYIESSKPQPPHWDRRFRIIVPTSSLNPNTSHYIRIELKRFGFKKVAHSLWAYPYECASFFAWLQAEYNLKQGLLFFTAQHNESTEQIRRFWKIS